MASKHSTRTGTMKIRKYRPSDWAEWLRMNKALFPVEWTQDNLAEMQATLAKPDAAVFVLERPDGKSLAGYVEAGTRSVVDGCSTSPVGYIEAWYVDPDVRLRIRECACRHCTEVIGRQPWRSAPPSRCLLCIRSSIRTSPVHWRSARRDLAHGAS